MWLLCECAPSLRAFMSSIMRWRRGVTAPVLMGTPVLGEVETPRSSRQATRAAIDDLSYRLHTGLNRNKAPAFPHKRWARHRTLSVFRSDYLIREGADGQVQQRPSRATEKSAEAGGRSGHTATDTDGVTTGRWENPTADCRTDRRIAEHSQSSAYGL